MRVAYACRDLATDSATGPGAHAFAVASAMARAGHNIYLISPELAGPWQDRLADIRNLTWRPLLPERVRHRYFAESHSYADRLYDTVRALHGEIGLHVIELPDAGGEALTLLRARRLLGEFQDTCLAVSLQPWSTVRHGPSGRQPATFVHELMAYAEQYARAHADVILAVGEADAAAVAISSRRLRRYLPGLVDQGPARYDYAPDAALTVLWLGAIQPGAGLGTVLRALELAQEKEPAIRLVLRGPDTPTDPAGRSYWQHVQNRLTIRLRDAVNFAGPVRIGELAALPPAGTQCVTANGVRGSPSEALLAMAAGYCLAAPSGSVGAGLVRNGETGRVVPDHDPQALADVLVTAIQQPETSARLARAAAHAVRHEHSPCQVADQLTEIYASLPPHRPSAVASRPDQPVSVVIPLFNQGRFLRSAINSIRRGGCAKLDIVVVDDGSTDPDTTGVLDSLSEIKVVRQRHRGLSAARNTGIEQSRGPFVLVLDADDMIAPGFLPAALYALRRHDDLGFVGGYVRYFGLLDLVYVPAGPVDGLNLVLHTHLKSMVLYRREALELVGGYDENLPAFEDWEIQVRLARAGYDSDVLPLQGQLYRRHAGSMSFSTSNGMRAELVQYMVRKHASALSTPDLVALLEQLVHMWKTGYEPSASVLLQRTQGESGSRLREEARHQVTGSPAAARRVQVRVA